MVEKFHGLKESNMAKKSKGKNNKKETIVEQKTEQVQVNSMLYKILNIKCIFGLAILLFYAPYFRGLYFKEEMYTNFIYASLLFLIFMVYKIINKDMKIFKTTVDFAALGLLVAYCLPILFGMAASSQGAYDKLLRYINFFLLYIMARDLIFKTKNLIILLNAVILSSIGISILGIDAGAGSILTNQINWILAQIPNVLHLQGQAAREMTFKFFGGYADGRIFSTLQYPNVLASYLGAVFILSIGLVMHSGQGLKKVLYSMAGFIFFYTLILTSSRGMILIFPAMFLLFLFILRKKQYIIDAIVYAVIPTVVGLAFSSVYHGYIQVLQYQKIWLTFAIGMAVSGGMAYASSYISSFLYKIRIRTYIAIFAGLAMMFIISIGFALNIEKPLVLKTQDMVYREIFNVKPNQQYKLEFYASSTAPLTDKPAYRVDVTNITKFTETNSLARWDGKSVQGVRTLDFATVQNTDHIRLDMYNLVAGSSTSFSNFKIINKTTGQQIKVIAQYKYLPTDLVYKIKDINLKTHNAWERFVFVGDAFRIIKDYPIFGAGGGAWKALYHKYQSYGYASNEAHNHFVQLWAETGTVGLVVLITMLALLTNHFIRLRKKLAKEENAYADIVISSAIFTALTSLYVHSLIDFDFSLSAVYMLVWALTGFVVGLYLQKLPAISYKSLPNINGAAMVISPILAIIILVIGINTINSRMVLSQTEKYKNGVLPNEMAQAVPYIVSVYEKYLEQRPLDEDKRVDYITLLYRINQADKSGKLLDYYKKINSNVEIAVANEPYSYKALIQAVMFKISTGQVKEGLEYLDRAVVSSRFIGQVYVDKAQIYLRLGQMMLQEGKAKKNVDKLATAKVYIGKAANMQAEIDAVNKQALKPMEVPAELGQIVANAKGLL
jgi:hypothetical protein